jgi:hypothetical protein
MIRTLATLLVSLLTCAFPVAAQQSQTSTQPSVPTVDFCEIVKRPQRFFNLTVRVTARWASGNEFSYLNDDRCPSKFTNEIAARFVNGQDEAIRTSVSKIMSHEYGGRALVTVVGTLRNPGKYYGYFHYLFEIFRFENVEHVITPYRGTLDGYHTYRALVRGDKESGLLLVPALQNAFHYAVRIEWINLSDFPLLEKLHETSGERIIVFSVISDERKQMTEQRWNRTLECKIIRLE